MWKDIKKEKPKNDGVFMVYGTVAKGTKHECKQSFACVFWLEDGIFTDFPDRL